MSDAKKIDNTKPALGKVELRSAKVRKILLTEPRGMLRWGTSVTFIIFLVITTIICLQPFPHGDGESIGEHMMEYILSAIGGK